MDDAALISIPQPAIIFIVLHTYYITLLCLVTDAKGLFKVLTKQRSDSE